MAVNVLSSCREKIGHRICFHLFQHSTIEKSAKLLTIKNEISINYLVPFKTEG
jgi:hypothetical protein